MTRYRSYPPFQCARGNRGKVINKPLRFHFGVLRSHIPPYTDDLLAIAREHGIKNPVVVPTHEKDLLAISDPDCPQRIIATTERNKRIIRRPRRSINRIIGYRD